jgi:hypothetical protein
VGGLREAVAARRIDEEFLAAARQLARVKATGRPSPSGAVVWSDEDIDDLIFDMISRVTPHRLVLAASRASDDRQFSSYLLDALTSELDLRARETVTGRVMRAVDDALKEDRETFSKTNGHWTLTGDDRDPLWAKGLDQLIDLAWTIETRTVRISPNANKTPPMAYRPDVRKVAAAVLELSGPLRTVQLAEVMAYRFNVAFEIHFRYIDQHVADDEGEVAVDVAAPDSGAMEELVDDQLAADWMLAQLTSDDRRVLSSYLAGDGVRGMADLLGCSKSTADLLKDRIEEKLKRMAQRVDGDARPAMLMLLRKCRTADEGATFPITETSQ